MKKNQTGITNLYSLLSSKWLITDNSANELMPSLLRIINGDDPIKVENAKPFFYSTVKKEFYFDDLDEDDDEEFEIQPGSIAILPIKGAILKYSQWCGPMGTKTMGTYLDEWKKSENIVGVLCDFDSGGGQCSGTPELASKIKSFSKPIVAYTDGMICSAAYWLASACDYIIANEYCDDIGSIGTMAKGVIVDGIIEKAGGKIIEEYATASTEKNNTFRELKKGNSKPFIELDLDPINERFHKMVKTYRPQLNESVFTGISYCISSDALKQGLIDEIGTMEAAIDKIYSLIDNKNEESTTTESESLNKNNMSQSKKYVAIAACLGIASVEASKGWFDKEARANISLTEDQLDALETALTNGGGDVSKITQLTEDLATAQAELTAANTAKTTAETSLNTLTAEISKQMSDRNLTDKGSASANVAELSAKVAEFGARGDAAPTNVTTKEEVTKDENADPANKSTSIFDSFTN
ncbi:Protease 4 [Algoriella xinjiangensis]|uniref:S49 family peptidase n=1 Tax=Algoriella xinjiangensis TaxID=684065 RepID=UPI000F6358C7|nr:S49 family peptidase [Algoriella xinjiangensis]VDH16877.1 Protease 4 [Algoriella xinjiangensis]